MGILPGLRPGKPSERQGRLTIRGTGLAASRALIRSRIEDVVRQAMATQPERRIVSIDAIESRTRGARGADDLAKTDAPHRARAEEGLRRKDRL